VATTDLDWDQIRLFLAVFRSRSLSGAATRLGLDTSTISRRLDRLEHDLGASLFDRTRDGTHPTSIAEQLVVRAEEIEQGVLAFSSTSAQVETRVEGLVRLTVPPGLADTFVAPHLFELHQRHPALVVELDVSISYADLSRREAEIALRTHRPTHGDLIATKVVSTRDVPMSSPNYAHSLGRIKRLEDARWIDWDTQLAHLPNARWLREFGPSVCPVLRTSHFGSQLVAARSGLGVVVLPLPYTMTGLVPIAHAKALSAAWDALPSSSLWLVGHRALRNVPRVSAVWEFLIEKLSLPP
jgi:DNA-binding transcriptional LysR family regulator